MPCSWEWREIVPDFGGVEESFGGNAPDMKAGAAEFRISLDDGCLETVLACADRGGVAAWTATDNHKIIGHLGHFNIGGSQNRQMRRVPAGTR